MTLTAAQLAYKLGCTAGQIKAWRRDAGMPVTRKDRTNRYEPERVAKWMMLNVVVVRGQITSAGKLWLARVYGQIDETKRNKLKGGER